jgi:hypothetical protein
MVVYITSLLVSRVGCVPTGPAQSRYTAVFRCMFVVCERGGRHFKASGCWSL